MESVQVQERLIRTFWLTLKGFTRGFTCISLLDISLRNILLPDISLLWTFHYQDISLLWTFHYLPFHYFGHFTTKTFNYFHYFYFVKYINTRRYGDLQVPTSSSWGLVAFNHLEGPLGPLDPTPLDLQPSSKLQTLSLQTQCLDTMSGHNVLTQCLDTMSGHNVVLNGIKKHSSLINDWAVDVWSQCKKCDGEGKEGRGGEPARVWGFDKNMFSTNLHQIDKIWNSTLQNRQTLLFCLTYMTFHCP